MELDKINSNTEIDLYRESREILEKCHNQIREITVPKEPTVMSNDSIILGPISDKEEESVASMVGFLGGGFCLVVSGMLFTGEIDSAMLIPISFATFSLVSLANAFITLSSAKSLGYRAQQLWRKMGLPARKLQALENQVAMESIAYIRQVEANKKKVAKINKKVQPELKKINAHSKEFVFEFGMKGLISTKRSNDVIHPSFIDLAKEIGA